MAPIASVHVGDIGTIFRLTFYDETGATVDISAATSLDFYFQRPDGSVFQKTPALTNSGTDGEAQYTSVAGDLNAPGVWVLQGRTVFSNGDWGSTTVSFTVSPNLFTR